MTKITDGTDHRSTDRGGTGDDRALAVAATVRSLVAGTDLSPA